MVIVMVLLGVLVAGALMFAVYKFVPGGLYINGALVLVGGGVGMYMTDALTVGNIFYLILFAVGMCVIGYLKSASSR